MPRRRSGSCGRCCGTGPGWSGCAPSSRTGSTQWWPISATTGPGSYLSGPGRGWLAGLELPAVSREIVTDALAVTGLVPVTDRIDSELRQHAKADPRVKTLTTLPGVGQFTALVMLGNNTTLTTSTTTDLPRFP